MPPSGTKVHVVLSEALHTSTRLAQRLQVCAGLESLVDSEVVGGGARLGAVKAPWVSESVSFLMFPVAFSAVWSLLFFVELCPLPLCCVHVAAVCCPSLFACLFCHLALLSVQTCGDAKEVLTSSLWLDACGRRPMQSYLWIRALLWKG